MYSTIKYSFCFILVWLTVITFGAWAQPMPLAQITVETGGYERVNTPVGADLQGILPDLANYHLQLIETTDGKEEVVNSQLETGYQPILWWVLEGKTHAGTERKFELRRVPKEEAQSGTTVDLQDDGEAVNVKIGDKNVLSYQYGVTPAPEGASELYSRGGYIHPLRSPEGEVLTRIQPPDHYHHYGIWNPWTHTEYKGKEVDFWNIVDGKGTVRVKSVPAVVDGDVFGHIDAIHEHVVLSESDVEGEVVLNEQWDLRVWNTDPAQKVWLIDFTSTLNPATENPLTIKEYRYGGFGFRATEKWNDETATLLTSAGKDKADGNATRARWCDVNGVSEAGRSGILFMTHPINYNFPEQIRIWPTGMNEGKENVFFNFNPAQDRDWKLEPGNNYTLKYRMMVYDGEIDRQTAENYWNDFAYPPKVKMQSVPNLQGKKILVYTKNGEGFVHDNIPASIEALKKLGEENGFQVDASEDPAVFTKDNLRQYDVLVFSNTNNETIDTEEQKKAFQEYIRAGGGFVGIHSASGSERQWPWFWKVLGGKFHRHAPLQDFEVKVIDKNHPSTAFLPDVWKIKDDECYYLKQLNPDIHVLLAADMTTVEDDQKDEYPGDVFGDTYPLAWYHEFDGGREWYTSLGHRSEHYSDPVFMKHILGGIAWVIGGANP